MAKEVVIEGSSNARTASQIKIPYRKNIGKNNNDNSFEAQTRQNQTATDSCVKDTCTIISTVWQSRLKYCVAVMFVFICP